MNESGGPDGRPPDVPDAVDSPYCLGAANPEVLLSTSDFVLSGGGHEFALSEGRIFLSSTPELGLRFEGDARGEFGPVQQLALIGWEPEQIRVGDGELTGTVYPHVSVNGRSDDAASLSIAGEVRDLTSQGGELVEVLFHVPNFSDFRGSLVRHGKTYSASRLELRAKGWIVTLDAREGLKEILAELGSAGGYAVTHVGRLRREDGTAFHSDQAQVVLDALHWFLSFVRGNWIGPILAEGSSRDGAIAWRNWKVGRTRRWRGVFNWCDSLGWDAAQEAFDGFMTEWEQPFTSSVMRVGVGQYVSANAPDPLEVAIVIAQSGLELLGWTTFVESNLVSPKVWKPLAAGVKISKLLKHAQVDATIPSATPALAGLDPSWKTGPEAVAGVRNRLVHPSNRNENAGWSEDVLFDAWKLSSRYLELVLLHRMGVTSAIRDRLNPNVWTGSKVAPPWVQPT